MYKAIKYSIQPNTEQKELAKKTFGCVRFVYNQILDVQEKQHANGEEHLSKMSANAYCTQVLKNKYLWLKEVDKYALTNAVYDLDNAYQRFFNKQGGFPKYKRKHKVHDRDINAAINIRNEAIRIYRAGTAQI